MGTEFKLPDIGEGLAEAEIGKWLVKAGDQIKAEQPFVEIETEKVTVEIPAPATTRIVRLLAQEGEVVPVGAPICVFEDAIPAPVSTNSSPADGGSPRPAPPAGPSPQGEIRAVPSVRMLARELGVDLAAVRGTGPDGRIRKEDVEKAAAAPTPGSSPAGPTKSREPEGVPPPRSAAAPTGERIPIRGARRRIAQKMMQSLNVTAQASYGEEIDVSELVRLRDEAKASFRQRGVRLTYMPFLIQAVTRALKEFPHLNASVDEEREEIVVKPYYNIGIAIHTEGGLVVPVVLDADQKTLTQLAVEVEQLADRARGGRLRLEEVRNGTFTITNPGVVGGLFSTPILNYPEVGILGTHRIVKRPVVADGQIVIRDMMNVVLTFDHRVIDGMAAAQFVQRIKRLLEAPGLLLLEAT